MRRTVNGAMQCMRVMLSIFATFYLGVLPVLRNNTVDEFEIHTGGHRPFSSGPALGLLMGEARGHTMR
jgi:hypothetical protein